MSAFVTMLSVFLLVCTTVLQGQGTQPFPTPAAEHITITGMVQDSAAKVPLRFVTIKVLHTSIGTMSSKAGDFELHITADRYTRQRGSVVPDSIDVVASMVAFRPDTVRIAWADTTVRFRLYEQPFRTREIVVRAENPAVEIMRRVIARKRKQTDTLRRYTYMLYTKFVAITDTVTAMRSTGMGDSTVFSVMESFSKGYVALPDQYFNEIVQRRQTANIPPSANIVALGTNLNLYDDELDILGEVIASPLSVRALDMYEFELESDTTDDEVMISVTPKGIARKAFEGTLFVDHRRDMPIEVRLTPNKAVNIPFDAKLSVRQTFTETHGMVMPEALSLEGSLQASILFILDPRLDLDFETFCYDYDFSGDFSSDVFEQRRVEAAPSAQVFDTAYWSVNQKLPLSPEEAYAYKEIEEYRENGDTASGSFLESILGPVSSVLVFLGREPFSGFEDFFRYNKIHGPYLGTGIRFRPDTVVELRGRVGYGVNDQRWYGVAKATVFPDALQQWSIDGSLYSQLKRRDDAYQVKTNLISLTTLLFGNDYGDYFYADGWEAGVGYSWGQLKFIESNRYAHPSSIRAFITSERQYTAASKPSMSVFGGPGVQRYNPAIMDGSYTSVGLELLLNYRPERRISRHGSILRGEYSNPHLLPTDAAYTRAEWIGFARMKTLPLWTLDVGASVGLTWGDVPPQKFYSLESAVSGIATGSAFRVMSVKEYYGNRYATFSLAHNFGEVIPGLLRIPNIASLGIELIAFGGVGWTQFSPHTLQFTGTTLATTHDTRERVYYEAGFGINRLLLFFRFDVSARLSQRDVPQFRVTITNASF